MEPKTTTAVVETIYKIGFIAKINSTYQLNKYELCISSVKQKETNNLQRK